MGQHGNGPDEADPYTPPRQKVEDGSRHVAGGRGRSLSTWLLAVFLPVVGYLLGCMAGVVVASFHHRWLIAESIARGVQLRGGFCATEHAFAGGALGALTGLVTGVLLLAKRHPAPSPLVES